MAIISVYGYTGYGYYQGGRTLTSSKRVEIYAPAGFIPTWNKFRTICNRDGQSASELVRIWIERYVKVKDPSNPQTPITAYDPTHIDHYNHYEKQIIKHLMEKAQNENMTLKWFDLMWEFRDLPVMKTRLKRAEKLAQKLKEEGVRVYR